MKNNRRLHLFLCNLSQTFKTKSIATLTLLMVLLLNLINSEPSTAIAFPSKNKVTPLTAPFIATVWSLFPNTWQVDWKHGYQCGGVLLSNQVVITAAHCLVDKNGEERDDLVFIAGETQPSIGEVLASWNTIIHPRFSLKTGANDIAVTYLNFDSRFGSKEPLKIASKFKKNRTWLYGWGMDQNKQKPSVAKRILQDDYTKYGTDFFEDFNPRTMIAAGYQLKKEKLFGGACFGDSGSPLVVMNGSQPELLGIVSNGADTCDSRVPSVYTRLSYYKDFINDSVEELSAEHKDAGLNRPKIASFSLQRSDILAGKVLPYRSFTQPTNYNLSTVDLQTTYKEPFSLADVRAIDFLTYKVSNDLKWQLNVYIRASFKSCLMLTNTGFRIDVGGGLGALLYSFNMPKQDSGCYDMSNSAKQIEVKKANFAAIEDVQRLLDEGLCKYPTYQPIALSELDPNADSDFVAGVKISLDPKCHGANYRVYFRIQYEEYMKDRWDLEPGPGMWIGPFKDNLEK